MTEQTYHGSCHCGAVRYEADIDFSKGTGRCNCSICTKLRKWGITIKPEQFRLIAGQEALSEYQFNTKSGHYRFCRHCGLHPFSDGYIEEIGGAFVSINIACLDDVPPQTLIDAPLTYFDGRNDNWWNVPAETRHL
jgi:hypothetical protein